MDESTHFGENGGKVLRPFKGGGKEWKSGEKLSAECVESWPLQNRIALSNVGKVKWYGEPAEKTPAKKAKKTAAKKAPAKRTRTRKVVV